MAEKKNKGESASDWKLLKEASQEVESWPNWLQKNAELLFEEEQEKQRKTKERPGRRSSAINREQVDATTALLPRLS